MNTTGTLSNKEKLEQYRLILKKSLKINNPTDGELLYQKEVENVINDLNKEAHKLTIIHDRDPDKLYNEEGLVGVLLSNGWCGENNISPMSKNFVELIELGLYTAFNELASSMKLKPCDNFHGFEVVWVEPGTNFILVNDKVDDNYCERIVIKNNIKFLIA